MTVQMATWRVFCHACNHAAYVDVPASDAGKTTEQSLVNKQLERIGWQYAGGRDLCPDCKEETA